jgi:hypothetical protein
VEPQSFSQTLLALHDIGEVAGLTGCALGAVAALAAVAAAPNIVAVAAITTAMGMRFRLIVTSLHW